MVAYLKKPTGSEGFQEIVDYFNGSHIRTTDNEEKEITATVGGKEFIITQASVRRHLQLADADGISVLPNTEIFDQLTLMGYVLTDDKLTFQKDEAIYKEGDDSVERATTTVASLDAEQAVGISAGGSPKCQKSMAGSIAQTRSEKVPTPPHDSPLPGGHTPGSDEGSMTLQELTVLFKKINLKISWEFLVQLKFLQMQLRKVLKLILEEEQLVMAVVELVLLVGSLVLLMNQLVLMVLQCQFSTAGMVQESTPSPRAIKDKGKAIMTELKPKQNTTKLRQRQERVGYEAAIRLQEQLDEEESQRIARDAEVAQKLQEEIDAAERQRMAQVHQATHGFTEDEWENIRERVEA
ncbi:hypothetical protein Tco_0870151, partial [Tanacetum coccineum]